MSSRPFAEATEAVIDTEVARLLREAEQHATALLRSHQGELRKLADLLQEQETVGGATVYQLVGLPVPKQSADTTVAPHQTGTTGTDAAPGAATPGGQPSRTQADRSA